MAVEDRLKVALWVLHCYDTGQIPMNAERYVMWLARIEAHKAALGGKA